MPIPQDTSRFPESGATTRPLLGADGGHADPDSRDEIRRFLERIYQSVARGDADGATDDVFDRIDGLLEAGEFAACDRILQMVAPDRLDSNLMVAFLVITLPAREHLRDRGAFHDAVKRILITSRGAEAAEDILRGLE